MANHADVIIGNYFITGSITVGGSLHDIQIDPGNNDRFPILSPNEELVIKAPEGKDIKYSHINLQSDVDIALKCSRTNSTWTLIIIPNDLPPDVPTTVKVVVGEEEP